MSRADDYAAQFEKAERARLLAGAVDGRLYSDYAPEVKRLMRAKDYDAAAGLLLRLIEAVERQAAIPAPGHYGVPEFYYSSLAACYAALGRRDLAAATEARFAEVNASAERAGRLAKDAMDEAFAESLRAAGERAAKPKARTHRAKAAPVWGSVLGQALGLGLRRLLTRLLRRR